MDILEVDIGKRKLKYLFAPLLAFICILSSGIAASADEKARADGEKIFKKNCQTCHSTGATGGCMGPVLAGENKRRSKAFIESRISKDPRQMAQFAKQYGHAELMPHLRVEPGSAKKLSEYVFSLPEQKQLNVKPHKIVKENHPIAAASNSIPKSVEAGKRLIYERGCLTCHSFGGIGGQFAPPFDGIGTKRSEWYIFQRISNAELLLGNSGREYGARGVIMPSSSLSTENIKNICDYLKSLK